jgi:DNA polymerase-3 subunit gamma/tau
VVRTLRNAVQRGKVHHAYLFVGSRGTGKTSMAKILAACLNCERAPTIEPCGECDSCVSIARATSLDVIEMDAASNNSVDDIRELRDSVAYAPVSGRRKVYILDEAHMLSTAAWNAFLKTLEEPPPNTVFVLATTEANKVPATVVDRCHRFDFHRPTVEQIASVVRRAAQAESIEIPPAAVAALARAATGSFRDALGTLEQIVTYSGAEIALEDVLAVLGVADARLLEAIVDAVAAGDAAAALRALEECVEQGRDGASFAADLEVRARELLVVQVLGEVPAELSLTPEADAALSAQAQRVDHATVVRLLELLGAAMEGVRAGADARTRLELALVKAARPETDSSMRALLARIERLEGGGTRPNPAAPAAVTTPTVTTPPAAPTATTPPAAMAPPPAAPTATTSPAPVATTPPAAMPPAATPPDATAPAAIASSAAPTPPVAEPTPPVTVSSPAPDGDEAAREETQPSPPEPPREQVPRDIESLYALWPAVVDLVRSEHALLGAVIGEARPVAVDGEELTLAYPFTAEFYKKKAEDPANRVAVGEALGTLAGGRWRLRYELRETPASEGNEPTQERSEEEWVARFVDEFDAEELIDSNEKGA